MRISLLMLCLWFLGCNPYKQGERLYETHCANCHMADGSGLGELIPPLYGSYYDQVAQSDLPCILRHGVTYTKLVENEEVLLEMPANAGLNEVELSNVINYLNSSWGNDLEATSPGKVRRRLEDCQ